MFLDMLAVVRISGISHLHWSRKCRIIVMVPLSIQVMRFCRFHFVGLDASTATLKIWGCNTYADLYMQYTVTAVHVPSPTVVLCITHNILFTDRVYINFPGIGLYRYKIVLKTALRNINIQLQ